MDKLISGDQAQKMSSKEISELTGKSHSNVMADIRNLTQQVEGEAGMIFQLGEYLDANNQKRPMYLLSKKESILLVSGYNAILRLKIINRWEELEEIISLPKTYGEALLEAGRLALEVENKNKQIQAMKPKADFFDQVTGSSSCFDMADVAKVCNLGVGRNTLFEFLRNNKILRDNNTPYQQFIDSGYFRVIESKYNKPDGSVHISLKTVVYQKGIDFIIKRFVGRKIN